MKKLSIVFTILFLCVALPAHAQNIALADADYLMNVSEAAKSIKKQLKTQEEKFKSDFQSVQEKLKKEEQDIIKTKQNFTEAELKKQILTFRGKMQDEEIKFKKKRDSLDLAATNAINELQKEVGLVIQEIAKEKSIDIVLSKQNTLFAAAGQIDITQDVLQRLNAKKKSIQVKTSQ